MNNYSISNLEDLILQKLKDAGCADNTIAIYRREFQQFKKLAISLQGSETYNSEMAEAFKSDTSHIIPENSEYYYGYKTRLNARCIKFIESYLETGNVDLSKENQRAKYPIESRELKDAFDAFLETMNERKLSESSVCKYKRFVHYFIQFLETKGIKSLEDVQHGLITDFISMMCETHYKPTSLNAVVPGLKLFILTNEELSAFQHEIPTRLPKSRKIRDIYTDDEYKKSRECIDNSERISLRDKAIALIAIDTGLRAVDISHLKLKDIDWEHDTIQIIQQKTDRAISIPLSTEIGNALVDYLIEERPKIESEYVFLSSDPPFPRLSGHTPIRHLLVKVMNEANIEANDRIYGTRITRHSYASRMLRKGVPIHVIAEALGHANPDTSMIYITTDDENMAKCTLPMPKGGIANAY